MNRSKSVICGLAALMLALPAQADTFLQGRAVLPADTFAAGPTSGQFINGGANGRAAPFLNKQPVQGFSAVLKNDNRLPHRHLTAMHRRG